MTLELLHTLPQNLQEKALALYEARWQQRFTQLADSLTLQERVVLISYFREEVRIELQRDRYSSSEAEDILVDFGDDEAIQREVRTFPLQSTGGKSSLGRSSQPKVVAAIAPFMFLNEPYRLDFEEDIYFFPKSFDATLTVRQILTTSPYFSEQVNKWAANWELKDDVKMREVMRNWWLANQRYFYSGNYAAVQPGEWPPGVSPKPSPTPAPSVVPMASSPAASSTPVLTSAPSPSPGQPTPPSRSRWSMIGLLVVLAIGFLVYRRGRK